MPYTPVEWQAMLQHFGALCLACRADMATVADHVVPESLGGSGNISNIQPLCNACNLLKGATATDYRDPASLQAFLKSLQPSDNAGLNLLRVIPQQRLVPLLEQHVEALQRIAGHQRLSTRATADENVAAQQRQEQEAATQRETTLAAIVGLRGEAAKYERAAALQIDRQMGRAAPADSDEARARQDSERDAWARWRPVLGLSEPLELERAVKDLAGMALAKGDDDTLAALRKELPAYITARAGKELALELEPIVLRALDETMAEARPDVFVALQARLELGRGMPRLMAGFAQAEFMITQGELSTVIPSWNPKDKDFIVQSKPVDGSQ